MKTIKYYWSNWTLAQPIIEMIMDKFPCWGSICQAMGYVRIECRVEDAEKIKNYLKNC